MNPNQESLDYASAVEQLETIHLRIESGEIKLEEMVESILKAKELMAYCHGKLRQAEQAIELGKLSE